MADREPQARTGSTGPDYFASRRSRSCSISCCETTFPSRTSCRPSSTICRTYSRYWISSSEQSSGRLSRIWRATCLGLAMIHSTPRAAATSTRPAGRSRPVQKAANTGDKTVWKDRLPIVESRVSEACTTAPEPHTKGAGHGEGYHLRRNGRAQGCHQAGGAAAGRDEACGVATGEREGGGAADGEEGAAAGAGGGALLLRSGSLRLRAAAMDPGGWGRLLGDRTVSDPAQAGRSDQDRSS